MQTICPLAASNVLQFNFKIKLQSESTAVHRVSVRMLNNVSASLYNLITFSICSISCRYGAENECIKYHISKQLFPILNRNKLCFRFLFSKQNHSSHRAALPNITKQAHKRHNFSNRAAFSGLLKCLFEQNYPQTVRTNRTNHHPLSTATAIARGICSSRKKTHQLVCGWLTGHL